MTTTQTIRFVDAMKLVAILFLLTGCILVLVEKKGKNKPVKLMPEQLCNISLITRYY